MQSNELSGFLPEELAQLPSFTDLDLRFNNISSPPPPELGQSPSLAYLDLSLNNLGGSIPPELGQLANLTYLDLAWNGVGGPIPPELGQLTNLRHLNLMGNYLLTGTIPSELGRLSSLQFLSVHRNALSGKIPAELGQLSSMIQLDLSHNQLSGEIPRELGQLISVTRLALDRNQLSGEIPAELGQLSSLQELNLFTNRLGGEIPSELDQLTNLSQFRLDSNQLSGSVPATLACPPTWPNMTSFNIDFNSFSAANAESRSCLNDRSSSWESTQTVPPTNVQVTLSEQTSASLTWDPVLYTSNGGYYEIGFSIDGGTTYSITAVTANKDVGAIVIDGLSPGTTYSFAVRTFTPVHDDQQNDLTSNFGPGISIIMPGSPPTNTPTSTNTITPTDTPTLTSTPTPTDTPTALIPTFTFTSTPIPPTDTPSTSTPTPLPTPTNTPTPTDSLVSAIDTPTPTPTPTATPTEASTDSPLEGTGNNRVVMLPAFINVPGPTPTDAPTPTVTPTPLPTPVWQFLGDGPRTVDSLAISGDTLFATDRSDGNGGLYQRSISDCSLGTDFVRNVSIESSASGIEFSGNLGLTAAFNVGIYYTQDDGNTWTKSSGIEGEVHSVAFVDGMGRAGAGSAVYQSGNGGVTWQRLVDVSQPINVISRISSSLWLGTDGDGVQELTSGSNFLTPRDLGLITPSSRQVWDIYIDGIDRLYLATYDGVFYGNGFTSWQRIGDNLEGIQSRTLAAVDDTLYVGTRRIGNSGGGVYQISIANPTTWTRVTGDAPGSDEWTVRDLLYDGVHCGGLLAATDQGVWVLR